MANMSWKVGRPHEGYELAVRPSVCWHDGFVTGRGSAQPSSVSQRPNERSMAFFLPPWMVLPEVGAAAADEAQSQPTPFDESGILLGPRLWPGRHTFLQVSEAQTA